ncbi:hypothetical protein Kpol_1030p43 [Vanderwaltozyma polyspora DSM 70294]|uniref:proline--tRNA ligase n=1 Tax=Vanderwaltozyma polyspora (strain ATCC 22028 / DSM 70294 / BCRC 21397 / CBS 2163 / NBRC 10782 / NRRL Y-8283 / UCD 57-17) TaxID=436907 RepID=A7TMW1_VANPO|nr:uncharacterized protein Kpol_1030p43 [Vanderwaltozyma polyspora DSM 70294]EDO16433.1 hypothetical protein Kpol_1030p43 [Vanderwaltozyma polyspora DSM 70294]
MVPAKLGNINFLRSLHSFLPKIKKSGNGNIESLQTADLMKHAGLIHGSRSGFINWLPLGLRSLRKLELLIHNKMQNEAGAYEVKLSTISPKDLWEKSNRWNNKELFKLKDSKDAQYCLTATCEEDITNLMMNYITSYKNMPITVYQIGNKFRDEKRPRGGLLRAREFLMKDAYSFARSKAQAIEAFNNMNKVYDSLFTELKIPFKSAWADSGDIGGDLSKEYHYIHHSGEDTLFTCDHCNETFNMEKCESHPLAPGEYTGDLDVQYALTQDLSTLICFYYPKGKQFNWNLAKKELDSDINSISQILDNDKIISKFLENQDDMMLAHVIRVMDIRINSNCNFPDFPLKKYAKNNFTSITDVSIIDAIDGELCGSCEEGQLKSDKSIEVGHTFHLGTKYTESFGATYFDENSKPSLIEMGCYGIGVSRLIGAIAEITRDSKGFRWPSVISPYIVSICSQVNVSHKELNQERIDQVKDILYQSPILKNEIFSSFPDKTGIGKQIELSQLIGIPFNVIIGSKSWPNVEIEVRGIRWDNSHKWEDDYIKYKDDYKWEVIKTDQVEKHIVPVEHVGKVIEILIQDI